MAVRQAQATYGLDVGTTGVIFAAIAIAWLAYLVPHFVRRQDHDPLEEPDPADRFSESMRIVQRGAAPLLDQDLSEIDCYEVSTPLTRRAAVNDLRRLERLAARRRRRVLLLLLAMLSVMIGVCAVGLLPWWAVAVPGGLLVVFVVVARVSVRAMRRGLEDRFRFIARGGDEATVLLTVTTPAATWALEQPPAKDLEPAGSVVATGRLWDPIPITKPTYVSKPLAPRTVRTIDLSGPAVTASTRPELPVTADVHPEPVAESAVRSETEPAVAEGPVMARAEDANGLRRAASA